jgi:hypothetical protein
MRAIKARYGWRIALLLVAACGLLFAVAAPGGGVRGGPACAQGSGDPRAVCVPGNPNTCAEIGLPGATFVQGAGDANVGFSSNGTLLNVTVSNPNVQLVVAVKGGPHLNLYSGPGTGYHAPPVGQNNTPGISHYFGCYVLTTNGTQPPPPPGGGGPGDPGTASQPGAPGQPAAPRAPAPAVVGQPRTTG